MSPRNSKEHRDAKRFWRLLIKACVRSGFEKAPAWNRMPPALQEAVADALERFLRQQNKKGNT